MIIVLKSGISEADIEAVCRRIEEMGYRPHQIRGEFKTVIGAVGEERGQQDLRILEAMETVESVMPIQQPFKLASREIRMEPSLVRVNDVIIGAKPVVVMAGPCSVESEGQVLEVADAVKKLARFHWRSDNSLITRSLGVSSAITLTERGLEFGASIL